MNGANDLEAYGDLNLNQMEKYGSDSNVTFVAQYKRYMVPLTGDAIKDANNGDYKGEGDWTGARRFVVHKDTDVANVSSPIVSTRADIDMGDPQTLKDFIAWGTKTFPAQHYAIVLWNHGAGWRSVDLTSAKTRGFSFDDETNTHIWTSEIADAIDLGDGRKWDLVSWDSSLMQMVEVAYEIRNKTNWIVGSEESPPREGLPYDLWVNKLLANPDADGRFVGESICDAMQSGYANQIKITQSLIDPTKIDALVGAVNDFGGALIAAKGTSSNAIADARTLSEDFDYPENKDVLDFARLVKESVPDSKVQATANAVQVAARAAIVKNYHDSYHPHAEGIAIYLPSPSVYRSDDLRQVKLGWERYTHLRFSNAAPNWQSFIANGAQ